MKIIFYSVFCMLLIIILYLLSLRGRRNFADFSKFKGFYYAHRGLHNNSTSPENSREAFKRALLCGYGAELDVHLLADGELAVIHDYLLLRTAGSEAEIEKLKTGDLKNYYLEGTAETIPTLSEVLRIYDGAAPLIIELKSTRRNSKAICRAVAENLKGYKGDFCIQSFDPRCLYWFKKHHPEIIRGQLSENYFNNKNKYQPFLYRLVMSFLLTNFITKPDFVAYRFSDRNFISFKLCQKLWKMQMFGWVISTEKQLDEAKKENIIPIFDKICP
ncbi:MAG: glycerophosphodiester phosphodiesterase family protein [Acutalibacteraceae bacterium]|jgi:glycerophosphoryl diester phosphodiesterase